MKKYLFLLLLIPVLFSCNGTNSGGEGTGFQIPENLKNKRISEVIIPSKWIEISSDNVLTLHIHINNSDEDFEFKANIGEYNSEDETFSLTFIGENSYQGRNDYKPSEVLPKLKIREGNNDIRLYVKGFNTIDGEYSEEILIFR